VPAEIARLLSAFRLYFGSDERPYVRAEQAERNAADEEAAAAAAAAAKAAEEQAERKAADEGAVAAAAAAKVAEEAKRKPAKEDRTLESRTSIVTLARAARAGSTTISIAVTACHDVAMFKH
jgi:hypothetical protein